MMESIEECHEDTCAAGSDRMSEGDGSAVDVDFGRIEIEFSGTGDHLRREGFVQFEEIDVGNFESGFVESEADGIDGGDENFARFDAAGGVREDTKFPGSVGRAGGGGIGHDNGGSAVAESAGISGSDGSLGIEGGSQLCECFDRGFGAESFIGGDEFFFFFEANGDGDDFVLKLSALLSGGGTALAFRGEGVLVCSRDVVGGGCPVGVSTHVAIVEGAPESVVNHGIDERSIPQAKSLARVSEEERGATHAFHSSCDDDFRVTGADGLGGEHGGLKARAANLVDRQSRDGGRESGFECGLTSGGLAESGGEDVSHDDIFDRSGSDASAAQGFTDGDGSEFGCGEGAERAEKFSDGSTGTGNEKSIRHEARRPCE